MLADDNTNTSEFIMTINYDGVHTQSYGGTTFLTHAPVGGSMSSANFGIAGGWAGVRTTSAFVALFPDVTGAADQRSQLAVDANKGIPAGAGIPPLMKANYVFRLQPTLAADLVKDQSLGFKELPSPTNYDKKIYGTQIMIGNSIYSITVFGL